MEWFKGFLWLRGICVWCCSGTREAVYLLASSADGNWLAAVSGDWEVHVYSLKHFKVQAGLCGAPCSVPRAGHRGRSLRVAQDMWGSVVLLPFSTTARCPPTAAR